MTSWAATVDLAPAFNVMSNVFGWLSPVFIKLWLLVVWLAIFAKIMNEITYRSKHNHSSWFFERLFSFWKPVFEVKEEVYTKSENSFYKNLKEVLHNLFKDRYEVYPKTRLTDVLNAKYSKWWFMQSHVDFLVVDTYNNFKPVMAVEVDWLSHNTRRQKRSDEFKDKVFEEAWLPLVRIKNSQSDNIKVAYAICYKYLKK